MQMQQMMLMFQQQQEQMQQQQELIQQQNQVMAQWMQRQPEPDGRGSATGMMTAGAPTATALMATGAPTATATGLMATGGASQLPVAPAQPGAMYGIQFDLPPENRVLRIPEEDDYKEEEPPSDNPKPWI